MPYRWTKTMRWGAILALSTMLGGCGEPNIQAMKPTVSKPTTGIFLVDAPTSGDLLGIKSATSHTNVNAEVQSVASGDLPLSISHMITAHNIGLCVVSDEAPSDSLIHSLAVTYPRVKFEWVLSAPVQNSDANVKQVVPDILLSAYSTGWLAGQVAVMSNVSIVGVLSDAPSVSKTVMEQALVGTYAVSPKIQMVPVSLAINPNGSSTSAINGTSNAGSSGVAGNGNGNGTTSTFMSTITLPRILIVTRPLSSSERQSIAQAGTLIYSLVPMVQNSTLATQPEMVPISALQSDFIAYQHQTWKPGVEQFVVKPPVQMTPLLVPQSVRGAFVAFTSALERNPNQGLQSYSLLDSQTKANWFPILQNAK